MAQMLIGSLSMLLFQGGVSLGLITPLATGLVYGGLAALAYGAQMLLNRTSVPQPEDGNYNLRQPVPSLAFVLGRVKKASDYMFLEQTGGDAYHVLCIAGHRIDGFVQHYLHDEAVTLNEGGGVISPDHFVQDGFEYVNIKYRLGLNSSTAYADLITKFPTVWSLDHRGDGLATVRMVVNHVSAESFQSVYPAGMPQHSAVVDGMRLYDPRNEASSFSTNIALFRFWHLTSPVGGKLGRDDLYLPEWQNAADVSDRIILNRDGVEENLYHGGMWFRAENNPVDVGRIMDQAAELVVYERPDGLVGVHAGEYVPPTIRLTEKDIVQIQFDANKRVASTVLAVRGQWTNPQNRYSTADAAIWGDPYIGEDTERTKTIQNQCVQSHNHMQRLQKMAMERANAPRVSVLAHYEAARAVRSKRFVKIHMPPYLDEAIVEIVSSPKLSLRNLTIEFTGIVWSSVPYAFDAATEEGEPPPVVEPVPDDEVPQPEDFAVEIKTESVGGGVSVVYGLATWTVVDDEFIYELGWRATSGTDTEWKSAFSQAGDINLRSAYLKDAFAYEFRLRTWAFGTASPWVYLPDPIVVYADTVAPPALRSFALASPVAAPGYATFEIKTPKTTHLYKVKLFRVAAGAAFDPDTDSVLDEVYVQPSLTYGYTDGDDSVTDVISNGVFASDTVWTKGTGWSIGSGKATHAVGTTSQLTQGAALTIGSNYRYGFVVSDYVAGSINFRFQGGTTVAGAAASSNGFKFGTMTTVTGNNVAAMNATASFDGSVDNVVAFIPTADSAPAGAYDYYAVPVNASGLPGPTSGPVSVNIA
ncbi:phage tail protein [Rhizobium alvei]|uniref:Tip attachment protein J domain-containing protein n=1 Tax=Rhizobium alvei TaxID=1132659 RepID=A0ABT8YVI0_9HYPH|nr:hypothetical protein [Rhizobium alvei]MDO6967000.1 hypothetical protein [Rhizobium alvei]